VELVRDTTLVGGTPNLPVWEFPGSFRYTFLWNMCWGKEDRRGWSGGRWSVPSTQESWAEVWCTSASPE